MTPPALWRTLGRCALAATATGAALGMGAALEARAPVQRVLGLDILAPGTPALTILHISDIHMWRHSRWEVAWLRSLAELDADFVVLTGDNLCEPEGLEPLIEGLRPLHGTPGAFVFGSNDYYSGVFSLPLRYLGPAVTNAWSGLRSASGDHTDAAPRPLRRTVPDLPHRELAHVLSSTLGWADLRNAGALVDIAPRQPGRVDEVGARATLRISLSGVDDPHINYDAPLAAGPAWEDADLRLGLTHAPYARVLDDFAALGADLVLAGHTHGGQICLPVGRALVNNCDAPLWASGGVHEWRRGSVATPKPHTDRGVVRPPATWGPDAGESTWIHVSRGLGTSKFAPIRLFCRPETTLIRLGVAKDTAD